MSCLLVCYQMPFPFYMSIFLVTVFLCVGSRLTVTVIFTLLRMVAHPCCSFEVRWTDRSLLFTKPKQSHNDRNDPLSLNLQRQTWHLSWEWKFNSWLFLYLVQMSQWHNLQYRITCYLHFFVTQSITLWLICLP